MPRFHRSAFIFGAAGGAVLRPALASLLLASSAGASFNPSAVAKLSVTPAFEPNLGQWATGIQFATSTLGEFVALRETGITLHSPADAMRVEIEFCGATPATGWIGVQRAPGRVNYLLGSERTRWKTGIARFQDVLLEDVWPGVAASFRSDRDGLRLDFLVDPGAFASSIRFRVSGTGPSRLGAGGTLDLAPSTRLNPRFLAPLTYQPARSGESRVAVDSVFCEVEPGTFALEVAPHDPSRHLVIDPILEFSSYLGGSSNEGVAGIGVDSAGYLYLAGSTDSADFPTFRALDDSYGGGFDAFVAKVDPVSRQLIYSTFIGGSTNTVDSAEAVAVSAGGEVALAGRTRSLDFPTRNAAQPAYGGGLEDAYVLKLTASGDDLVFGTFLGGSADETASAVSVDAQGGVWTTGVTWSGDFPVFSQSPPRTKIADAFVARYTATGERVFSTYFGGFQLDHGTGIAVSPQGEGFVAGFTTTEDEFPETVHGPWVPGASYYGFLAKFTGSGDRVFATLIGGTGSHIITDVATDGRDKGYVFGSTTSRDFPIRNGFQTTYGGGGADAFLTIIDTSTGALEYSTYLGGSGGESSARMGFDPQGNLTLVGTTGSTDFPVTAAVQPAPGGDIDGFMVRFDAAMQLRASTYVGGSGADWGESWAWDPDGSDWVAVASVSSDLPVRNGVQSANAGGEDAWFAKIRRTDCPAPGNLGNVLRMVKEAPAWGRARWSDVTGVGSYALYSDLNKFGFFLRWAGAAPAGDPGIAVALPLEPLVFYRMSGTNACGEGPQ